MNIFFLHPLLNIIFFAIPLALFEISVEKAHGWGSGWSKDKWYAKSILRGTKLGNWMTRVSKLEPPLNYHLVLSYLIFPGVFVLEYIFGYRNILLVISSFFFVILLADIAWFSFNWHFDSWTQLLKGPKGSIFWHKDWIRIAKDKYLPQSYFSWLAIALVFWILAWCFRNGF
jgi:hypothetical protein